MSPWWPFGGTGDGGKEQPPEKEPSVSDHTMSDIVRGIQHAVNAAQELTEQHYVRMLERYFDSETGRAITQRIPMPDGQHVIDLPLITAIPPNGLMLKEMLVEMAVRIDNSVIKKAAPRDIDTHLKRTSFEVSFAPRAADRAPQKVSGGGSAVDVSMKFVAGDPPEGVSRVLEYFTNALVPRALETGEPAHSGDGPPTLGAPPAVDAPEPPAEPDAPGAPEPPDPPDNPADESD